MFIRNLKVKKQMDFPLWFCFSVYRDKLNQICFCNYWMNLPESTTKSYKNFTPLTSIHWQISSFFYSFTKLQLSKIFTLTLNWVWYCRIQTMGFLLFNKYFSENRYCFLGIFNKSINSFREFISTYKSPIKLTRFKLKLFLIYTLKKNTGFDFDIL